MPPVLPITAALLVSNKDNRFLIIMVSQVVFRQQLGRLGLFHDDYLNLGPTSNGLLNRGPR